MPPSLWFETALLWRAARSCSSLFCSLAATNFSSLLVSLHRRYSFSSLWLSKFRIIYSDDQLETKELGLSRTLVRCWFGRSCSSAEWFAAEKRWKPLDSGRRRNTHQQSRHSRKALSTAPLIPLGELFCEIMKEVPRRWAGWSPWTWWKEHRPSWTRSPFPMKPRSYSWPDESAGLHCRYRDQRLLRSPHRASGFLCEKPKPTRLKRQKKELLFFGSEWVKWG